MTDRSAVVDPARWAVDADTTRRTGYAVTTVFLAGLMAARRRSTPSGRPRSSGSTPTTERAIEAAASSSRSPTARCRGRRWRRRSTSRCTSTGGFDGPVRIAVDQEYLRMWDENGLVPAPVRRDGDGAMGRVGVRPADRRHAARELRRPDRARRPGGAQRRGRRARRRRRRDRRRSTSPPASGRRRQPWRS